MENNLIIQRNEQNPDKVDIGSIEHNAFISAGQDPNTFGTSGVLDFNAWKELGKGNTISAYNKYINNHFSDLKLSLTNRNKDNTSETTTSGSIILSKKPYFNFDYNKTIAGNIDTNPTDIYVSYNPMASKDNYVYNPLGGRFGNVQAGLNRNGTGINIDTIGQINAGYNAGRYGQFNAGYNRSGINLSYNNPLSNFGVNSMFNPQLSIYGNPINKGFYISGGAKF